MRFPLALTAKIAGYIIGKKLRGVEKFATVLQLEPLHTCNLTCTGCGRIREYSTSLKNVMSLADCLGAAEECEAPMISICGGEPLIYPQIEALVEGLLQRGRIVYICTNATLMRKKMREYLAAGHATQPSEVELQLERLLAEGLISEKDAEEVRKGPKDAEKPVIAPSRWMYWNVHLDGLERTHDLIVEREGVFKEAVLAMRMAKVLGYQVATNTTVYRETDVQEIDDLFAFSPASGWTGIPFHRDTTTTRRRKTSCRAWAGTGGVLPHAEGHDREICEGGRMGPEVPNLPDTGVPRIPGREAGSHLFRLGDSDAEYSWLEGALLSDDGRSLRLLSGALG